MAACASIKEWMVWNQKWFLLPRFPLNKSISTNALGETRPIKKSKWCEIRSWFSWVWPCFWRRSLLFFWSSAEPGLLSLIIRPLKLPESPYRYLIMCCQSFLIDILFRSIFSKSFNISLIFNKMQTLRLLISILRCKKNRKKLSMLKQKNISFCTLGVTFTIDILSIFLKIFLSISIFLESSLSISKWNLDLYEVWSDRGTLLFNSYVWSDRDKALHLWSQSI